MVFRVQKDILIKLCLLPRENFKATENNFYFNMIYPILA